MSRRPLCVLAALAISCGPQPEKVVARLELADVLSGAPDAGFARALAPRAFVFPADHGPHPEFRNEWWYWTGNLAAQDRQAFGFQLTFFRTSLAAPPGADGPPPPRTSPWATNQAWMAHFALTDVDGGRFVARERFGRGAAGLAGATTDPFAVWVGPWSARDETPPARLPASAAETLSPGLGSVRLRAEVDHAGVGIDIYLTPTKPRVLQGDRGLSAKGPEPGNASFYYSLTRLAARGTVRLDGAEHEVDGSAWLDREWSTSALGRDEVGWDWFALQLADGRELMLYQLRRRDGGISPFSAGTLVDPAGATTALEHEDFTLEPRASWESPRGASYPARWRVLVPAAGLDLDVRPRLADQELDLSVRYWEGAVTVSGSVGGVGYVELTGY